jgi:hypothetical protein
MKTRSHYSWIWPRASLLSADQSLCFKTSGVDHGDVYWTSQEHFSKSDVLYGAMRWIFENRKTLPVLVLRERIDSRLAREPLLQPLSDGLHFIGANEVIGEMGEALGLSVTSYTGNNRPSSLMILNRLSGANCFLFLGGVCEAEACIGSGKNSDQVTALEALSFFKSMLHLPPESPIQ